MILRLSSFSTVLVFSFMTLSMSLAAVDVNQPGPGGMTPRQCFTILRQVMSPNWYDESLWPACLGADPKCVVEQQRQHPDLYPEDYPGPCGGEYNMDNQPQGDVGSVPGRPVINPPRPAPAPVPAPAPAPAPGNDGGNANPQCRGARQSCDVGWQCCSNHCGLDGLCQAGEGGCLASREICQVGWECCSGSCDEILRKCR